MLTAAHLSRATRNVALAALLVSACGCKAREMGVEFADKQAVSVDDSWVTALKTCWPAMAHDSNTQSQLKHELADPLHFRAAFGVYAQYTDAQINELVAHSAFSAPPPQSALFANSPTPVLTLQQAASGVTTAQRSVDGSTPDNAFCSLHPGIPVGFK